MTATKKLRDLSASGGTPPPHHIPRGPGAEGDRLTVEDRLNALRAEKRQLDFHRALAEMAKRWQHAENNTNPDGFPARTGSDCADELKALLKKEGVM